MTLLNNCIIEGRALDIIPHPDGAQFTLENPQTDSRVSVVARGALGVSMITVDPPCPLVRVVGLLKDKYLEAEHIELLLTKHNWREHD